MADGMQIFQNGANFHIKRRMGLNGKYAARWTGREGGEKAAEPNPNWQ